MIYEKKKIGICGHFGIGDDFFDGQTVKTRNVYNALIKQYGRKEVNILDTHNWKKNPIQFLKKTVELIKSSKHVILLPAQNGVRVFIPIFLLLKKIYKSKIYYVVIGGWLPQVLSKKKVLTSKIKKIDKVFVETNVMKKELNQIGINNVEVLTNFKDLEPIQKEELKNEFIEPYKLCTFSRVLYEKGIEDAIKVIDEINSQNDRTILKLDIYGKIDNSYKERFEKIMENAKDYINYKGCVKPENSVNILKEYYLLLFPTRFWTEGIPGTIIDSLFSGLPILTSEWKNVREIIDEGSNGLIYEFNNIEDFKSKLLEMINNNNIYQMRLNCIEKSKRYRMEEAIKVLTEEIDNNGNK